MKSLAICVHGNLSKSSEDLIIDKFSDYDIEFFKDDNADIIKSLHILSLLKRDYEIQKFKEFDICMAILVDDIEMLNNININPILEDRKLYFYNGKIFNYSIIEIFLNIFYSNSHTFDRVCEFSMNKNIYSIKNVYSDIDLPGLFYCHIKSLMLNTECINRENSNLFIRPTQNN